MRVLLADDNELFRSIVRSVLHDGPDFELAGEAVDGEEAVRLVHTLQPDIVIMDVMMPRLGGIEATRRITREYPSVKVVALSMHADEAFVRAMREAGAASYLLKETVLEKLLDVLRSV